MRPKIRIYKYLNLFFNNLDKTGLTDSQISIVLDNKQTIFLYWLENPDQRLTQMLFNLFDYQVFNKYYYQEDINYLNQKLGIELSKIVLCGTYGKNGDEELRYVYIENMETEHIENILSTQKNISKFIKDVLIDELTKRKNNTEEKQFEITINIIDKLYNNELICETNRIYLIALVNIFKSNNIKLNIDSEFVIDNSYLYFNIDNCSFDVLYNLFVFFGNNDYPYTEINKNNFRIELIF